MKKKLIEALERAIEIVEELEEDDRGTELPEEHGTCARLVPDSVINRMIERVEELEDEIRVKRIDEDAANHVINNILDRLHEVERKIGLIPVRTSWGSPPYKVTCSAEEKLGYNK